LSERIEKRGEGAGEEGTRVEQKYWTGDLGFSFLEPQPSKWSGVVDILGEESLFFNVWGLLGVLGIS